MIRVISAYRVSQDSYKQAGETTSCKQQVRSLMLRGVRKPNPKKRFLTDLSAMLTAWRKDKPNHDIILMADMNEYIGDTKDLYDFCQHNNLIDTVSLLNPDLMEDPTYLWGSKRIDYILVSPPLAELALKAGHHQYHQHFISDHKGVYIQFNAGDIFDTATVDKSHASYRRLRMGRRDIVERYVTRLVRLYKEHHIWERAVKLAQATVAAPTEAIKDKYFNQLDRLDQERICYMRAAENYAGLPPANGAYEWSPSLEKAGQTITYWKLRLNLIRSKTYTSDRLKRLYKSITMEDEGSVQIIYVQLQLKKAWAGLRQIQRQSIKIRESHMEKLADHFAEKRNTTRAIEVKKISTSERTRSTAAKHKWYLKERHGMIRNLLIPDYCIHEILSIIGILAFTLFIQQLMAPTGKYSQSMVVATGAWGIFTVWEQISAHEGWKVLSDETMITSRLLLRNGTHLSMSGDSPFARGPLAEAIGLDGEGDGVEDMLNGTFDTDREGLDGIAASSEMRSFIKALQIPTSKLTGDPVHTMQTDMTVEDSIEIFSGTKESTSSSPSGIHYGHYIAACENELLAAVNHIFMLTPFKVGRPLTRWVNSLHCMIQKMKLAYVTKLRIVQLYEADFNTMLKFLLGYKLMKHCEKHGINGHQLYGSRKGKCAYDALITVRIIYDMARIQRDYIISLFNDLKGAYDRVRPSLNTVTTRRAGLSKEEAICHARALRKMKHFLRTGFGVSAEHLVWDILNNPGGLGQGNGGGRPVFIA